MSDPFGVPRCVSKKRFSTLASKVGEGGIELILKDLKASGTNAQNW